MRGYLYSLDYLRGFAALAVCLFHFTDKLEYLASDDIFKQIFSYGHFGVEVFFVISGVVIPYSMFKGEYTLKKFPIFLKKRFIRIEPPYLVCIVLVLFLNYLTTITPFYVGKPFTIDYEQVLFHLGYLNVFMGKDWLNQVFWTLAIEFQYYILVAIIFPLINSKNLFIFFTTLFLFNLLSFHADRSLVFNFSIFFTAGIALFRYFSNTLSNLAFTLTILLIFVFCFIRYNYAEILVLTLSITIVLTKLRPTFWSTFFGDISYSLYLLHLPIGLRIINISQRFSDSVPVRYTMILLAVVVSIGVSFYYYKFIESPFKKISQKIKYSPPPALLATDQKVVS
jgi:peptidoglycan/LPS O-acetylase OafA/YrhL